MKSNLIFLVFGSVITATVVFMMACGQEGEKTVEEVARPVKMLKLDVAGAGEVLEIVSLIQLLSLNAKF